jgi:hypothetical protein
VSKPVSLILVTHGHVPCGAADEEFEDIYTGKLKPFIVALNNYPAIQGTLHYSGVLLHWIERAHPEFFMLIEDLIRRKQVELVGGGFYEPMMPLISQPDKIGQIEMLTDYLRKHFNKRPLGCWLPALVWEPGMVGALNRCGMAYTFLAAEQFQKAGLEGEDLFAPCITEEQGKLITVFPVSYGPAGLPEGLSGSLEKFAVGGKEGAGEGFVSGEGRIITICPDGILTGNLDSPEGEKITNRFFQELSLCESFTGFTTPGKVLKNRRSLKKVYFGADSKSDAKRFLIECPEANGIYAKMIFTHVLVNQLRGDKARKTAAREELWKAQGYDVFCRTESGGIHRNTTRNAVYRSLLLAEKTTRVKGVFTPALVSFDFDFDGEDEYLFQNDHINAYIKRQGASVFEFDFLPRSWNYLDTLLSHETGAAPNPAKRRAAFADILAIPGLSPAVLCEAGFALPENAGQLRFCGAEYYEVLETEKTRQKASFRLGIPAERYSRVEPPVRGSPPAAAPGKAGAIDGGTGVGGIFSSIEITKTYHLKKDSFAVRYSLVNRGSEKADFDFIPRLDFAFPGEGEEFLRVYKLLPDGKEALTGGVGELPDALAVELDDLKNELLITLGCDKPFNAHFMPVYTSCPVHGKERRLYQSTCILPITRLSLESAASWSADYTLKITY